MRKILVILVVTVSFLITGVAFAEIYPEGMVSYWKFDEDSGDTAYDSVSNNDGTIYEATRTTGQVDDALSFDGVDDYVQAPHDPSFNIFGDGIGNDTAGSVAAWIKMNDADVFFIVGTPITDPESRPGAWIFLVEERLRLIIYDSDGDGYMEQRSDATLTSYEGQWIHVAATYDGSKSNLGIKLYLNGALVNSNPMGLDYSGTGNAGNLNIGYWSYQKSSMPAPHEYPADGLIDEVAIYNRALTPEEIQQHYQNGLNGQGYELPPPVVEVCPQEMVSYWKFDEVNGTTAYDSGGTSDGEIQGTATWSTGDYMVNGALSFDGTSNYVEVPDNPSAYQYLDELSISAWIKYYAKPGISCPYGDECRWSIVSKYWNLPGSSSFILFIGENNRLGLSLSFADGDGCNRSVSAPLQYDRWYHVTGVYDQTDPDGIILYIDGERQTTTLSCNSGGDIGGPLATTDYPLQIGRYVQPPHHQWFFKGFMDEVATFDRALTPEEIQQHYINGLYGEQYCMTNEPPVADPNGPYLCEANASCDFDGSLSVDSDSDPLTYAWNFGDTNTGAGVSPAHTYTAAGIYDVCLTVNDGYVDSEAICTMAVVYDPAAGFATGGGWINSPEGAYVPDPSLTGKATFGFVSKYKEGATEPTGQTEFQFHVADLNFHSENYDWLVVTGSNYARFKGSGTFNGVGDYRFLLWAGDDEPDTFRIKIWEEDEFGIETVTYDNGMDQAISGGSIKVHTR